MASDEEACTKPLEQATPSAQFPTLQRDLDQLEALSKKLEEKTIRTEAPSQSIAATRLLAREGINAEQHAWDLKSFELKTTFEDVFPAEATSVEEYLQQEAWQKEKRDFPQSLSRISTLPRTNMIDTSTGGTRPGQIVSTTSSAQLTSRPSGVEVVPLANRPIVEKKASVYTEVVRNLNNARESGSTFQTAAAFRGAYETVGLDTSSGKSVTMQKIWHLIQTMMGEGSTIQRGVSKKMSLVIGARRHLEWGHEKYIMDTIQSHPAQAALGGAVGNIQKIRAFLRIHLRDYGVLDFDAAEGRRQPPVDTTWQQIYSCLRTGFYDEARSVALSSRSSHHFAPLLTNWINSGGMVSLETANVAVEECEKMLRMGDRVGRATYDKKKLLLYATVSGSHKQIDHLLRDLPTFFNTIEDFLWFKLSAVQDLPAGASSVVLNEGLVPYSLDDLQVSLNKFEPSYYTKNGKDPLVYPYVLLLSVQLLPAVLYLSKETGDEGYNVDAVHMSIVLADHGILSEGSGAGQKLGVMDAYAEISSIIRQYGSAYLRLGNLPVALEYYAQAAATVGGGQLSWTGRGTLDQQRQRSLMLNQLLFELLLRDGGIHLLLGPRGAGEEGELGRFLTDIQARQQFLLETAHQFQETGLYDKSIEIHKRVGGFSMALDTVNKCLSEAICSLSRGTLDGESRADGLVHSGNDLLETYKCYPEVSPEERVRVLEQQTVLRQLEAILYIYKLASAGLHEDVYREVTRLQFLPLDPRRVSELKVEVFQNMSPHVKSCVPDLLKIALICLEVTKGFDGSLRTLGAQASPLPPIVAPPLPPIVVSPNLQAPVPPYEFITEEMRVHIWNLVQALQREHMLGRCPHTVSRDTVKQTNGDVYILSEARPYEDTLAELNYRQLSVYLSDYLKDLDNVEPGIYRFQTLLKDDPVRDAFLIARFFPILCNAYQSMFIRNLQRCPKSMDTDKRLKFYNALQTVQFPDIDTIEQVESLARHRILPRKGKSKKRTNNKYWIECLLPQLQNPSTIRLFFNTYGHSKDYNKSYSANLTFDKLTEDIHRACPLLFSDIQVALNDHGVLNEVPINPLDSDSSTVS